eukprot:971958-Alexandrium_andersonii.AAC.1
MEVGALEPESPEVEADEQQLQAAFTLLLRAFRPARAAARAASPALPMLLAGLRLRAAPRAPGRAVASRGGVGSATKSGTGLRTAP